MRSGLIQIVTQMEAGGAQRCAIENARVFQSRNMAVETWFLYRKRGAFDDEPGVSCLLERPPEGLLDYLRIFASLWLRLRRVRPRTVITYSHYANIFGCLFAALSGVPNRCANQTGLPSRLPDVARYLDILSGSVGIYSSIISNSRTNHAALLNHPDGYVRRLFLVPNGVAAPTGYSGTRSDARHSYAVAEDTCLIVTVGRLAEVKNQQRLIRAAAGLQGIAILIAGDGECRAGLEKLISDLDCRSYVRLLGEQSQAELARLFAAADAFILPSLWESFGLAPLEAAASGLPIAVADIPAMHEVAGNPDTEQALFFDPESEAAIGDVLTMLRDNPELRRRLAAKSSGLASVYSVQSMADGFLEVSGHVG